MATACRTRSSGGYPVGLERPLVNGLPAGWSQLVALLRFCRSNRLRYQLTTDLGLIDGAGPRLAGHAGVVLAGDERWVPSALGLGLRAYVAGGGHVLSLGIDSLRRGVTLGRAQASHPTGPRPVDLFGARYGAVAPTHGSFVLAGHDARAVQDDLGSLPLPRLSELHRSDRTAHRRLSGRDDRPAARRSSATGDGRGLVIDVGIPGFASELAASSTRRRSSAGSGRLLAR